MDRLRIMPLLVIVALLAFSVRLVEFVGGVSALSGAAQAQSQAQSQSEFTPDQTLLSVPAEPSPPVQLAQAETGATSVTDTGLEGVISTAPDDQVWRDPADEDPGYDAVRMEVFQDLAKRRDELDVKERELRTREAILKATEQEIDSKYQELVMLRDELENLLGKQSDEEKARINSLVKVYEGMKPKEAARIFDTLDLDVLVAVVAQMSERRLSPVLAAMDPERARTVTIILAEQRKLPSLPLQGN